MCCPSGQAVHAVRLCCCSCAGTSEVSPPAACAGQLQGQRVTQEPANTASLASFLASARRQEPFDCDKKIGTPKVLPARLTQQP